MFSAVTSAFIIQFGSQLQPDSNDETAALLRVLIYKIDNTTFGNNVPALPQWAGPPRAIVQVQAILFASLAISLLSAFLAMLGKQWLNRYESIDKRGSAIERCHNRQKKLGGIVGWYFDHVMESLPMMLQAALLLLGCALTRYLWEVDVTVASVVLSVVSSGVLFYLLIVIAGSVSESCPYQTPAADFCRYILHHLLPTLRSAAAPITAATSSSFSRIYHASWCCQVIPQWWLCMKRPWYSMNNVVYTFLFCFTASFAPFHDAYRIGKAILRFSVSLGKKVYHGLMGRHRKAYRLSMGTSIRTLGPDQQAIGLDLWCISWILQTSLDTAIHLSAFNYLTSMPALARFHPTLPFDCFNTLIGCININNGKVIIMQGLEPLATASANGFSRTLHYLATMDPTSSVLADLQQRYNEVFPSELDFTGLPFHSSMIKIHALAGRFGNPRDIRWHNYKMTVHEHIPFAQHMLQAAQEGYQQTQHRKVPRWILHCALYCLSLGPMCPPSAVANCLTIIAIDLGCNTSDVTISDERCVQF